MNSTKSHTLKTTIVATVAAVVVLVLATFFWRKSKDDSALVPAWQRRAVELFSSESQSTLASQFAKSPLIGFAFFGNMRGQAEPCTCAFFPHGGSKRIRRIAASLRSENADALVLSSGNNFDNAGQPSPEQMGSPEAILSDLYNPAVLTASNVARSDLFRGLAWLKSSPASAEVMFSANLVDAQGNLIFKSHLDLDRGGKKLRIIGLSSEQSFKDGEKFGDPLAALKPLVSGAPADLIVVLADLNSVDVERVAELLKDGVPSLILGSEYYWDEYERFYFGRSLWINNRELSRSVLWTQIAADTLAKNSTVIGVERFPNYRETFVKPVAELESSDVNLLKALFAREGTTPALMGSKPIFVSAEWDEPGAKKAEK